MGIHVNEGLCGSALCVMSPKTMQCYEKFVNQTRNRLRELCGYSLSNLISKTNVLPQKLLN